LIPDKVSAFQPDNDRALEQQPCWHKHRTCHWCEASAEEANAGRLTMSLGDARLRRPQAELEQLTVDARCAPQRIVRGSFAGSAPAAFSVDLRPASQGAGIQRRACDRRAGTVPRIHGLELPDDRVIAFNRREPSIQWFKEQRHRHLELDATTHLSPQHGQLMPERSVLCLSPALRLDGWNAETLSGSTSHRTRPQNGLPQITEAFPWDEAPRYLIRDRDRVYGGVINTPITGHGHP